MVTLSRPAFPSTPRTVPSTTPGLSAGGTSAAQERTIICVRAEQPADIEPHRGRRHQAEIRQHRIAAADARNAERDVAEPIALGDRLQLRPGIGDGDEPRSRFVGADRSLRALEEILLQDIRLERAAGLARHDEESSGRIDLAFDRSDLRGIGRVEHQTARDGRFDGRRSRRTPPVRGSIRPCRGERCGRSLAARISSAKLARRADSLALCSSTMSSQPSHFASSAPVHRLASPAQSRRTFAVMAPRFERGADGLFELGGKLDGLAVELVAENGRALAGHRAEQLVERVGEELHALLDQLCRHRVDRDAGAIQRGHHLLGFARHSPQGAPALSRGRGTHPSSRAAWC